MEAPRCTKCQADLSELDARCPFCGSDRARGNAFCPECRADLVSVKRSCPFCGRELAIPPAGNPFAFGNTVLTMGQTVCLLTCAVVAAVLPFSRYPLQSAAAALGVFLLNAALFVAFGRAKRTG
jgi:hypothetical protein